MKILILGAGQVGRTAAYHLSREPANEVTVVDTNEDILRDLQDRLDIRAVAGHASYPAVLEAAGIADTDVLVALTNSDEVNIVACEIAHALYRTPTKIARVRAPEYTTRAQLFTEGALAVDVWISPEQLVTEYIARLLSYPGALQVVDFADGRVQLVGVRARRDGLLVGRELRTLREHLPDTEARVAAIYRNDKPVPTAGDTVIEEDDEIFFVAASDDLRRVMAELRRSEDPVRRLVIAGGGNIGFRLARTLEKSNQVKVIERDARRARRISELLENTIVLNGDAADEELLVEENIDSADVFAALTNSEEANVLSAMLAKRLGAKRVMALINRPSYGELMENHAIDIVISPQTITIGSRGRRGAGAFPPARRGRGHRGRRSRHAGALAGGRPAAGADQAAGRRQHHRHRARRKRDHGESRHQGGNRRSCNHLPHRSTAYRRGRAPVPDRGLGRQT